MECIFSCRFAVFRTRNVQSAEVELTSFNDMNGWKRTTATRNASYDSILKTYASLTPETIIEHLESARDGLTQEDATKRLAINGPNVLSCKKPPTWWMLALSILPDPFNIILLFIAIISMVHQPRQWITFITLIPMIIISFSLRFWQEYRSSVATIKLQETLQIKVLVRRRVNGYIMDMLVDEKSIVPGDILIVNPGDAVPADCMLLSSLNLSVSQSSLTGESEPQRKTLASQAATKSVPVFELGNLIFKGTGVISGSGLAIVLKTGDDAFISTIFKSLNTKRPLNSFQRGIRRVSYIVIIFMLVMVPISLVVSGVTTKKWGNAAFLAVSVAVGLVPEMLPAIVNANLARGAFALSKNGAIIKRLDSVQVLGAMSVLCSDKTGTLTKDEIALCHHVNVSGNQCPQVLQLAHINAVCQSGKKNSIDTAILNCMNTEEKHFDMSHKVYELSFNFENRRSSCIVRMPSGKLKLICKGALEEVLSQSRYIRMNNESLELDDQLRQNLLRTATTFNYDGYRVVLVATREIVDNELSRENFDGLDSDLIIEGLLTFLDPPKDDAKASVARLQALGIDVKILTGDSIGVAMKVCQSLELIKEFDDENIQAATGPTLVQLEGDEFHRVVKHCKVFAKLTPSQKGDVINSLKEQGEVVGMLGDGINDCVALRNADAGISVDTGTSVAKECADVILTQKKLSIIAESVVIGRVTQGNTIKYIKMVASSNFGNVFSLLISSAWVPFNPMTPLQILVQNVLYDVSQIGIPWDHVDPEYLGVPQQWAIWDLLRFILILGPTSSTIDIATFCINWFYYGTRSAQDEHGVKLFQSQWYLVGLLTQTLVVYLLRTPKFPFIQSRPSKAVVMSSVPIMILGFLILYIPPFANALGVVRPGLSFLGFSAALVVLYVLVVQLVKMVYIKLFGRWL